MIYLHIIFQKFIEKPREFIVFIENIITFISIGIPEPMSMISLLETIPAPSG